MNAPRMTPWLQQELHGLAVRFARNGGARSQAMSERLAELAAETGFSWSFLDSNMKMRAAEIMRGEGGHLG